MIYLTMWWVGLWQLLRCIFGNGAAVTPLDWRQPWRREAVLRIAGDADVMSVSPWPVLAQSSAAPPWRARVGDAFWLCVRAAVVGVMALGLTAFQLLPTTQV